MEGIRLGKRIIVCIHKNIGTGDIGKSVVGRNIVDKIDYEKFESGPSILRIADPLIEQRIPTMHNKIESVGKRKGKYNEHPAK